MRAEPPKHGMKLQFERGLTIHNGESIDARGNLDWVHLIKKLFSSVQSIKLNTSDVAGVTGLEPATFGVTGRRSNQLSYTPISHNSFSRKQVLLSNTFEAP
jgi:hypothetical protein